MKSIRIICKAHVSTRKRPINLKDDYLHLFEHALSIKNKGTNILQLYNVHILHDDIFNLYPFKFYTSYCHVLPVSKKKQLKKLLFFLKPSETIKKAIWIIDEWSGEYFHWLTDALTRLVVVEDFRNTHTIILPSEYEAKPYIRESLTLLNFKVHYYHKRKRLKIKELILPSHTAFTGNYNKEIISILRKRLIKINEQVPHRKIFVSRQKAARRKIQNEEAVTDLLHLYHYEVHFFEDYTLGKQIEIMRQAKLLIGLHGAGLTNMLFMPVGGKVLELRNENDSHNNCFFALASDLGHDYYFLTNASSTKDTYSADINVDIDALRSVIELMEK